MKKNYLKSKWVEILGSIIAVSFAFTFTGCSNGADSSNPEESPKTTTAISISCNSEISATGTATLTANLTPSDSTESISWQITSGSSYATLSSTSGKTVTLTGTNTTTSDKSVTVKATSGSKSATKTITVKGKNTPPTTYSCSNCGTSYSTANARDNCAVQYGCPKYVIPTVNGLPSTSVGMAQAMQIGWNLGNTLDAGEEPSKTNEGLNTETSWGMPSTTKEMIDAVAAKGFKTIRIPVSWHSHISSQSGSDYIIDTEWMARVKQIVDWSLGNNMFVILNIHHDNFSVSDMSNTYGYAIPDSISDSTVQKSKDYIQSIWTQIANKFKEYDNRLVFEVLNEPRARGTSVEWWVDGNNNQAKYNSVIKEFEQLCVTIIRGTGGNNATRFLMVPTYAANADCDGGWSMPTDTVTDRLLLSAHCYTPGTFALNGTDTEFTGTVENSVTAIFNNLNTKYVSKNIGVVIGEGSASNKNNDAEREKWITYYFGQAKKYGIPVVLWDNMHPYNESEIATKGNGEFHDWFNRNEKTWWHEDLVDLMITIATGNSQNNNQTTYTTLWTGTSELDYSKGDNNGIAISASNITAFATGFRFTYTTASADAHIRIMSQSDWADRVISSADSGTISKPEGKEELTMLVLEKNKTNATVTLTFSSSVMSDFATNGIKFYGQGATITKVELVKNNS